ncbi:menaquinone-dependent protoporphyrinogen IX dehydrogenase [Martelella alba]|uniref:Protoporphyrinogen IX dehydrogenase [quinone] n=1 Tax=Martelella alba TaxID=2590451 RepID=A0ABY2SMK6_9HYPH|nr:menaquinone-dependent protoporphyrinogen IX dehydrogenase [Martelella alba]TKI07120.1 menaquinone-dependent protoporphyrinogen IX dehydrogenase [Martelella alba]
MRILILYSSRDGQTRKIARFIGRELIDFAACDVVDLEQAGDCPVRQYDGVIIGASIHYGHYAVALNRFIKRHLDGLNTRPGAFFSVNLTARKPDKRMPGSNVYTRKFLAASPWHPERCAVFAGALRYPRYRWFDRIMIQLIMRLTGGETDPAREVEYTDWQQVGHFARDFAAIVGESVRRAGIDAGSVQK